MAAGPPRHLLLTGAADTNFANPLNWNDATDGINPASIAPASEDTVTLTQQPGPITGTSTVATLLLGGGGDWQLTSAATLSVTSLVSVGTVGVATLLIENASTLLSNGSAAVVTATGDAAGSQVDVIGNGALWNAVSSITVGQAGLGSLSILSGGTATSGASVTVGAGAAAGGSSVHVDGGGSALRIAGTLNVGSASDGDLVITNGGLVTAAGLDSGIAAQNGSIAGAGLIQLSGPGSTLLLTGDATVADAGSASMSILNDATFSGTNLTIGSGLTGSGQVFVSDTGSELLLSGTLNVGTSNGVGELTVGPNGTVIASKIVLNGQVVNEGGLLDPNEIDILPGNPLTGIGTNGAVGDIIVNDSSIEVVPGSQASKKTMTVIGTIVGTYGTLSGTGALVIDNTGTMVLQGGGVDSSQSVVFKGASGLIKIGEVFDFDAVIAQFQAGDTIAVQTPGTATFSQSGSVVSVLGNGGTFGVLTFGSEALATTAVNTAGALVDVPCFARGTRIRTERGEVAVEALREGDLVWSVLRQDWEPVVWIGQRSVACGRHPRPERVWPVHVAAGAFGAGVPVRDLYLSPDHAVYVDGVLIPVKRLVNGTSIVQVETDAVTYYHVELRQHDVLLAEGLAAESYLDAGDRANFANGGAVVALHPEWAPMGGDVWEAAGCAPLVLRGPVLEAVRRRIAA